MCFICEPQTYLQQKHHLHFSAGKSQKLTFKKTLLAITKQWNAKTVTFVGLRICVCGDNNSFLTNATKKRAANLQLVPQHLQAAHLQLYCAHAIFETYIWLMHFDPMNVLHWRFRPWLLTNALRDSEFNTITSVLPTETIGLWTSYARPTLKPHIWFGVGGAAHVCLYKFKYWIRNINVNKIQILIIIINSPGPCGPKA